MLLNLAIVFGHLSFSHRTMVYIMCIVETVQVHSICREHYYVYLSEEGHVKQIKFMLQRLRNNLCLHLLLLDLLDTKHIL